MYVYVQCMPIWVHGSQVQICMLVLKHSFTFSSIQTWSYSCNPCNKKALTENRESCISRVHTERMICHTPDDATVCCSQSIYSKSAAATVYIICGPNLKPPILTNILHAMNPWDTQCGRPNSSAIECSVVLDTISHCSHNWLWSGYNTWLRACMDKGKVHGMQWELYSVRFFNYNITSNREKIVPGNANNYVIRM